MAAKFTVMLIESEAVGTTPYKFTALPLWGPYEVSLYFWYIGQCRRKIQISKDLPACFTTTEILPQARRFSNHSFAEQDSFCSLGLSKYHEVVEPSTAIIPPLCIIAPVQKAGAAQLACLHLLTQAKCNPPPALQAPSLGPCDARYPGPHAQKFSSISLRRCRLG